MRTVFAALAAAVALSTAGAALACSCMPQTSAAEHLAGTDLAFTGRVLGTRVDVQGYAVTRFRVAETLKGRAPRTVAVSHHTMGATCGLSYRPGARVLVLAERREGGVWRTSLCSAPQFPEVEYRQAARARPTG
ncbi:MAG: hypothetical protein KY449_05520 [Proteobacteria bacterium]|nr:hypothetical protein [Pseudomonadota bacterium]